MLAEQADLDQLLNKQKTIDQDHALALTELNQKIEKEKQDVVNAQKDYDEVKADYDELAVGSSSANADLALSSRMRERNDTFQNAVLDLKKAINDLRGTLDSYDQVMGISSAYRNDNDDSQSLGAKDASLVEQSKTLFDDISLQYYLHL